MLSLTSILDAFVHSRFLHYLTIDLEGFEYGILEDLVGDGKLAHDNITICQIDAELHNAISSFAHPKIKDLNRVQFILNFLQDGSPYLPIFNVPYKAHPHQKVTFINIHDKECEKAFGFSAYFK